MGGWHPCSLVTAELDNLLTALHVLIDDHATPWGQRGAGRPRKMLDAERVCPAMAPVSHGAGSKCHWLRPC